MTTPQEMERIVRTWLEPGLTTLTDDVLDGVMDQLPATPQRRRWSARRVFDMNPIAKYAIAAAAVVVIAIAGFNLLRTPDTSPVGAPGPSATSRPASPSSPSASRAPIAPSSGVIDAGRYRWSLPGGDVSFDLPDGWTADGASILKNKETAAEISMWPSFPGQTWEITHVYTDACRSAGALEPIGDGVDDLVTALDAQKSTDVVISDVTAGSVLGKRIEVFQDPALDDRSKCRHGLSGPLQIWSDERETGWYLAIWEGARALVYTFGVDGDRLVFSGVYGPEAAEADIAAVDAIIASMEFAPR